MSAEIQTLLILAVGALQGLNLFILTQIFKRLDRIEERCWKRCLQELREE